MLQKINITEDQIRNLLIDIYYKRLKLTVGGDTIYLIDKKNSVTYEVISNDAEFTFKDAQKLLDKGMINLTGAEIDLVIPFLSREQRYELILSDARYCADNLTEEQNLSWQCLQRTVKNSMGIR